MKKKEFNYLIKNPHLNIKSLNGEIINTSNFDNQPVSLMEIMALGLPIITTNVGGIPFLINHNSTGILVNQNDSDEIVVAVTDLITQKINGFNLITNARNEILNYDKSNVLAQWFCFIDNTIK